MQNIIKNCSKNYKKNFILNIFFYIQTIYLINIFKIIYLYNIIYIYYKYFINLIYLNLFFFHNSLPDFNFILLMYYFNQDSLHLIKFFQPVILN